MESSLFLFGSRFSLSSLMRRPTQKPALYLLQLQHCHSRKKSNLYSYYLLTWVWVAVQHSSTKGDKLLKNFTRGLWSVQTHFHFQDCVTWLVAACVRTQVTGNPNPFPFSFLFPTGTNPQKQSSPKLSCHLDTWCMLSMVLLLPVKW